MLHRLVISSPNLRKTIDLKESSYFIGRHPSNSIVIASPKISRVHATLLKTQDTGLETSFCLLDGDLKGKQSKNGVFVNGEKISKYELKHGDVINFTDEITASYYIINHFFPCFNLIPEPELTTENKTILTVKDYDQSTVIENKFFSKNTAKSDLFKLASLVELSPNPIIEINFKGEITYLNSAAIQKFKNIQNNSKNHTLLQDLLDRNLHKNGSLLIREVKIGSEVFEQHIHYLTENQLIRSYIFDITQRKIAEETLHYQAYYDSLTDLPNRTLFNEKLAEAMTKAQAENYLLAVMFLDLDGFKNVNDTFGHTVGDHLLKYFAQRLKNRLRHQDMIARWGGDEFTILIPKIDHIEEAKGLATRIIDSLKEPFHIAGNLLYLKTSIGIAIYPQHGEEGEILVKNADAALYRTKETGKNNYQFYSPIITSQSSEKLRIENLLHEALNQEQFILQYQPQVNIKTGKICGMEALIRWNHPELGVISPAQFIPIAEETGLIISIGEWVLQKACQQNRLWQESGLPSTRIAVNLSAQQFQQPNFVDIVTEVLKNSQLDPQLLELEITETAIMQNVDLARQIINNLREMGVYISMDDFGTGYSSLGYLKQIPFHTIKIDQTFIKNLRDHPQDLAIISAVLAIGRGFNLRVIAEGVESQYQVDLLKNLDCEEMQGYQFSHPLNPDEAARFLTSYQLSAMDSTNALEAD